MAKIVVFGVGQLAEVARFYITHDSPHEVTAFTVDSEYMKDKQFLGLPVVPFEEVEATYSPDEFKMFVPISYRNVNKLRAERYERSRSKGYELISYVSSRAMTWPGLVVGDNCLILENSVIQPFVDIGNNVSVWAGSLIAHHSQIRDHCFLAASTVVSGSVRVEPYCFLGTNSTVRDNISIAKECVIGAGALVLADTQERGVYVGRPAKLLPVPSSNLNNI